MKKRFLLIASLLALSNEALIAQQNPTPYTTPFANTPAQAVTTANAAWYRGGNNNTGPAGNANIFGTLWNSPIYTQTAGITRMVLRGGGTGNNAGRMKLGNNLIGAFTPANRLHLQQTGGDLY